MDEADFLKKQIRIIKRYLKFYHIPESQHERAIKKFIKNYGAKYRGKQHMNKQRLKNSIRRHEGLKLTPYTDTTGHLTIGYGHNLDAGITERHAEAWLDLDLDHAIERVWKLIPDICEKCNPARLEVLIEMYFNLGDGLLSFRKMLAYSQQENWIGASEEMLDSLWARQIGNRAHKLAMQYKTGKVEHA